jgi:hypothetical protein
MHAARHAPRTLPSVYCEPRRISKTLHQVITHLEWSPDPAVEVRARIARDPKKMERFFARGLQRARKG